MAAPWDRRSVAEQQRVQALAMGRWLPSVVRFCAHWGRVAEALHLDPEELGAILDVQRFGTSRERELVAQCGPGGAALVMRPTEEQVKAVATTSTLLSITSALRRGGQPAMRRALLEEYKPVHVHQRDPDGLVVAYSRRDLDRLHLAGARAASLLGLDDADYLVSAIPAGPTLEHWGTYHLALGASMLALRPRGHGQGLEVVAGAFSLAPATAIAVRGDEALDLAAQLAEAGAALARVRTVVVVGPVPSDEDREAVAEAYRSAGAANDLAVLALWAPAQARALWAEQRDNPGALVTYPDLELVEVVDPMTGLPTQGPGDLTISSIGWTGTAAVRFQTGSWVGGVSTEPDPVTGRTAARLVGGQQPDAWSPSVDVGGRQQRIDLRGVAATVGAHRSVGAWLFELRGPTQRIRSDRLVLELGGDVAPEELDRIAAELPDAVGVDSITVRVAKDAEKIEARVDESASHFVDLR